MIPFLSKLVKRSFFRFCLENLIDAVQKHSDVDKLPVMTFFPKELHQVIGQKPYRRRIVIGVDADEMAFKIDIEVKIDFSGLSLRRPKGVTAPGVRPKMASKSSAEAKERGRSLGVCETPSSRPAYHP